MGAGGDADKIATLDDPEVMNAIVSGRDKGKRSERFLLARKMYRQKIIFSLLTSSKEKGDCHFPKI